MLIQGTMHKVVDIKFGLEWVEVYVKEVEDLRDWQDGKCPLEGFVCEEAPISAKMATGEKFIIRPVRFGSALGPTAGVYFEHIDPRVDAFGVVHE